MSENMRSVDDISSDYANASTDKAMHELKRFRTGYVNLCHDCVAAHNEIPLPTDMVVRKHGTASATSCENCGQLREAQDMSTYRVWYR